MAARKGNARLQLEVERHWPRLTRFYGFSPEELWRMPRPVRRAYIKALPKLEAAEQLARIEAALIPNMKKEQQRKIFRRLERTAEWERPTPVKAASNEDAAQSLAGLGIKFEMVDKNGNPVETPA
jgi:hypothetical protein